MVVEGAPRAPWGVRTFFDPKFVALLSALVATLCVLAFFRYLVSPLPLLDLYAHLDGALDWQRGLDPYHVYLSHRPGEIGGGYVFPPFTLPLALALAHIPRQAAASLWTLAGVAALAWLLWDLAKPRTPTRLAAVTLLAVFFYPLLTNFALGQVGIVALLGAWIAGRLASKRAEVGAGLALGLASLFKLFPLLVGGSLILRGRWRALVWAIVVIGGATVVTWPFVATLWPEYVAGVLVGHMGATSPSPGNQSIAAAVVRTLTMNPFQKPLLVSPTLATVTSIVLPLALVAGVAVSVMGRPNDRLHDALLLACLPLVVPNAWQHYYIFSFPLLWMVVSAGFHRRDPWLLTAGAVAFIALSWIAGTVDDWYFALARAAPGWHGLYANASVLGGLLLVVAGVYLVRREAVTAGSASQRAA